MKILLSDCLGKKNVILLAIIGYWLIPSQLQSQTSSTLVFDAYRGGGKSWAQYKHLKDGWYTHIHQLADQYLDERKDSLQACTSIEKWELHKVELQAKLLKSIGGLPAKTPLNARVIEILDRKTFRVEKLIYESLPGYLVTAGLFVPKSLSTPAPAVIYCSGHTREGFRSPTYQKVILNLVHKGFIVLAFDPVGQGERYQYLDAKGNPNRGGPTSEHSYAGIQAMLSGHSIARYMIHDGIRAVDYLLTRPEVDPKRIGITGRSGGGTQSAYIAAFDPRIHAAAPENYITSFRRLLQSIGPQDAEQNFLSAIKMGIDHGDLLATRAPKPALVLTTSRDFFSIQGARETFAETQRIYDLYGARNKLYFTEDDHGHGSTKTNRESLYGFFQRHLDLPGDSSDVEVDIFTEKELTITADGQVVRLSNSKTVYDLNLELAQTNIQSSKKGKLLTKIKQISGITSLETKPKAVFTGRELKDDFTIEKYFLEFADKHYPIPFLWIQSPNHTKQELVIYLNSQGKAHGLQDDDEIAQLVRAGYRVLAVDLLNVGELQADFDGDSRINEVSYNLVLGSSLVGTSLPILQAGDLTHLLDYIQQQYDVPDSQLIAIADHGLCIPLLHVAALNKQFKQLILREPLISWQDLIQTKRYAPALAYSIVPGSLPSYDLPDLMQLAMPSNLTIVNPQHADGLPVKESQIKQTYQVIQQAYNNSNRPNGFSVKTSYKGSFIPFIQ